MAARVVAVGLPAPDSSPGHGALSVLDAGNSPRRFGSSDHEGQQAQSPPSAVDLSLDSPGESPAAAGSRSVIAAADRGVPAQPVPNMLDLGSLGLNVKQVGDAAVDPLADVLNWLSRTKYDMREDSAVSTSAGEDAPMADICEETSRGGPVLPHQSRQLRPKANTSAQAHAAFASRSENNEPSSSSKSVPNPSPPAKSASLLGGRGSDVQSKMGSTAAGVGDGTNGGGPEPLQSTCHSASKCIALKSENRPRDLLDEEEEEWDNRQRKSGTVGRLVVYNRGERPREDIVLRGGGRRHIVVAGLREGGQAARTGVRAGDRLVSIDGRKDFLGLQADAVRERLSAPTVLVFLGFVGKLQAEVRLTNADHVCGVSARRDVLRGCRQAPVMVCEERVFNVGLASLFLTVSDKERPPGSDDESRDEDIDGPWQQQQSPALFELQRNEAHSLVKRAMRKLEGKQNTSAEKFVQVEQQEAVLPSGSQAFDSPQQGGVAGLTQETFWSDT